MDHVVIELGVLQPGPIIGHELPVVLLQQASSGPVNGPWTLQQHFLWGPDFTVTIYSIFWSLSISKLFYQQANVAHVSLIYMIKCPDTILNGLL